MIGEIDKFYTGRGFCVIGADEAGRGPLCGPVVTAAVSLFCEIPGVNDSKKLSEKKRLELVPQIIHNSYWAVYSVLPKVIDEMNILHASLFGMGKCVSRIIEKIEEKLPVKPFTDEYKKIDEYKKKKIFLFSDIQKLIAAVAAMFFFAVMVSELTPIAVKVFDAVVKIKGGI